MTVPPRAEHLLAELDAVGHGLGREVLRDDVGLRVGEPDGHGRDPGDVVARDELRSRFGTPGTGVLSGPGNTFCRDSQQ